MRAIAQALSGLEKLPTSLVTDAVRLSANQDVETFDNCLPYLVTAAYVAQPTCAAQLSAELNNVAELVRNPRGHRQMANSSG